MTLAFRRITPADVPACAEVVYEALEELSERLRQPPTPRNPAALRRLLEHLLATDPALAWLAHRRDTRARDGAVVGMGLAVQRDRFWFLSFLFVVPEMQGRGLGRELLGRCLAAPAGAPPAAVRDAEGPIMATCVDALQPVSTGLYASQGIVPRVPLFALTGRPAHGRLPGLPDRVQSVPFETVRADDAGQARLAAALESVDRAVLGFARPQDHVFREREGRGTLYRAAGSADFLGYGYVQPSGSIGPVALLDAALMPAVIADLMTRHTPVGAWRLIVPGVNEQALVPLLRAGLRFDGPPAIFSATRDGPRLEGYLPAGFALP